MKRKNENRFRTTGKCNTFRIITSNDAEPEYKNCLLNDNQSFAWNVRIVFVVYLARSLKRDRFNNVIMHTYRKLDEIDHSKNSVERGNWFLYS